MVTQQEQQLIRQAGAQVRKLIADFTAAGRSRQEAVELMAEQTGKQISSIEWLAKH